MGDQTRMFQTGVAGGIVLLGLGLGWGAWDIPADAGYSGVGPNFLPWVVSVSLTLCGAMLMFEARTTGFADLDEPTGDDKPYWMGFVWMSAGLLINAALITRLGFIVSCALCFVLACRGMRNAQGGTEGGTAAGQGAGGLNSWVQDAVVGLLIAAPVYWMFTRFLAINLPSLTNTGWI
ncbi:MAG: tripartite tricarboxylate transporter TctB [Burkholderiales bacterium PBB3]|nr:MAG: tripartite tricarboxylate transporter TctB [Burkholderiales bacterium PBB3]